MKEEFLSIQSAAEFLGVSPTTLRRWEEKGVLIPERTFGNQRRYALSVLKTFNKKDHSLIENPLQPEPEDPKNQNADKILLSHQEEKPILQEYLFTSPTNIPVEPFFTKTQSKPQLPDSAAEPLTSNEQQAAALINKAKRKGNFFKNNPKTATGLFLITCFVLIFTAFSLQSGEKNDNKMQTQNGKSVLGLEAKGRHLIGDILFSIPAIFDEKVTINNQFEVNGKSLFTEDIEVANKNVDLGTGKLTASNVVYTITAGANVSISGDPQNPTISANLDIPNAVVSFQGQSGNVTLAEGDGIGLDGLTISNTGVLSLGGETGDVELTAGDGIEVDGTTITNTDTGSAQNIFKEFIIDGSSILAESNSDVFTFEAGSGIVLTPDTTTKKLTITSNASGTLSGLSTNGVLYATDSTNATSTSPGTTGTVLKGVTGGAPVFGAVALSTDITGTLPIGNGGTGVTGTPSNGQLLIGNGSGYTIATMTQGSGIGISNGAGTITVTNNGVLSLTGTANQVNVSGATGSITLSLPQSIHTGATPTFASMTLSSNTNQLVLGTGNTGTFTLAALTSGQTYTLPNQSGEVCLSTGNCPGGGGGSIDGSGTANYLAKFTSATDIGNSLLYDTGQKIGIGTISPQGLFSVSGASTGTALVSLNETGNQDIFAASSSGTTRFTIGNNGNLSATGTITGLTGLTSSGTVTFSGLTTNNGLVYTNGSGALSQAAAGTTGQLLVANGSGTPVFVSMSSDASLAANGALTIAADAVALTTDTTGNYVQTVSGGSGISISGSAGEGWTPSFALGPLTGNWDQTGAFDIILNNSASELRLLESSGAFYATLDAGDLDADKTYVLPNFTGSSADFCLSTGNCDGGAGGSKWQLTSNVIAPLTATDRLVLGGNISTGHQFEVNGKQTGKALVSLNETGNQNIFTASASGTTVLNITRNGNLQLLESAGNTYFGTIAVGDLDENETYTLPPINGASSADICLSTGNCAGGLGGTKWALNSNTLSPLTATDKVILGGNTTSPFQFEVNGRQSGKALMSLNETGNQDIFTASASGTTRMTLSNGGNLNLIGGVYQSGGISGITQGSASCVTTTGGIVTGFGACQLGSEQWIVNNGAIYTGNPSLDLLLGGNATASSKFAFTGISGGTPTASISAASGNNATFLTGTGNLGTTNAQTLTLGGASTGDINLAPHGANLLRLSTQQAGGNVSIGTSPLQDWAELSIGAVAGQNSDILLRDGDGTNTWDIFADIDGSFGVYDVTNGKTPFAIDPNTPTDTLTLNASGGVGIGNANPTAILDVNGSSAGKALTILNETGGNDIFTASASGATKFTLLNSGTIRMANYTTAGGIFYGTSTGDLALSTAGSGGECLVSGGTGAPTWGACGGGSSTNYWNLANGLLYNGNTTTDFAVGGNSTTSAKFLVTMSGTRPTASVSANTADAALLVDNRGAGDLFTASSSGFNRFVIKQNGNIGIDNGSPTQKLQVDSGNILVRGTDNFGILGDRASLFLGDTSNAISAIANTGVTLSAFFAPDALTVQNLTGNVGIGTTNPVAKLDIRGNSGTTPIASFSGQTTNASVVVDQSGTGDLFSASKSGATKFTIQNSGNISLANYNNCGMLTTTGTVLTCSAVSGGISQYWRTSPSGTFSFMNDTMDFLFGGNATSSAKFKLSPSGTGPTALVSANTSHAALTVNNIGNGDLFSASSSGTPVFIVDTNGNLGIGSETSVISAIQVGKKYTPDTGTTTPKYITVEEFSTHSNFANGTASYVGNWYNYGHWGIGTGTNGADNTVRLGVITDSTNSFDTAQNIKLIMGGTLGQSAKATLDIRTTFATLPAASFSGSTTFAAQVVDQSGSGDIFAASKSGATKFVITNAGNVGIGTRTPTDLLWLAKNGTSSTNGLPAITLQNTNATNKASALLFKDSNSSLLWQITNDWNEIGAQDFALYDSVATALRFYIDPSGRTVLGLRNNSAVSGLATLDVRGNVNTQPAASLSASSTFAGLVVDNTNTGDLFTASKSGATKFVIKNNGDLRATNYNTAGGVFYGSTDGTLRITAQGTSGECLQSTGVGGAPTWGACGAASPTNHWTITNGLLYNGNTTTDFAVGGISTTSAKFLVSVSGTRPTASVSANTSSAGLVVDNSGFGDLFTASKSGKTHFVIRNSGTVVIGNATDGITLDPQNGGPSYVGNARPTKTISLQPEYSGAVLTAFYGAGTDTNITGNLTSDVETSGTNNLRSYYQWERTTDATQHFYTVAVRVRLPKDFSAWTSSNAIQVDYITESATSTNSDLDVRVYIENDASMASTDAESLNNTSTSWSTIGIAGSSLTEVDAADETAVIYLRMGSASSNFVKIGEIRLNYLSRF